MTKVLEILHLVETEEIRLSINSDEGGSAEGYWSAPPVEFKEVLSPSFRREIDWYFQGYLDNPSGPAKDIAEAVESTMRDLGRLLFQAAMQSNQEARDFYTEACAGGLSSYHLTIVSTRPEFLALPWELLNDPQTGYLAAQFGSVSRRAITAPLAPVIPTITGLIVLVVIAPPPAR